MVIYVSDKDFDTCNEKIVTFNDVDLAIYDKKYDAYDIVETIERGAVIKSLEQHDAEIIKPLEDEIKRLKFESENIQKAIQHVDEAKYNAQQDDIEFFVKQAKQEVIYELLNWAKENNYEAYVSYEIAYVDEPTDEDKYFAIDYDNLKQKLNEMKEVEE